MNPFNRGDSAAIGRVPGGYSAILCSETGASDNGGLVDKDIIQWWKVHDMPGNNLLAKPESDYTPEEKFAADHYTQTTRKNENGNFVVKLPIKPAELTGGVQLMLGNSEPRATRSLLSMEKQFKKDDDCFLRLHGFMNGYIESRHLVKVDFDLSLIPHHLKYYLPHHAVLKESTTTPFRVVVNGSAKSTTGLSLNDTLAVGPTLQPQLVVTLIAFRLRVYAFTGDISKMYRQVLLDLADQLFHLMLWRNDPEQPIETYAMHRVSYGVASSCYHAIRTLQEIAKTSSDITEEVRMAILNDFYVDDLMTGSATKEGAKQLLHGIIKVLGDAGMPIRKFASNDADLVTDLPESLRENAEAFDVASPSHLTHSLKILGMRWLPIDDFFVFLVNHVEFSPEQLKTLTKRLLLADIMKLFDPVGWLSPVTLLLKAFMQVTWEQGLGWDEPLPEEVKAEFIQWREHLVDLRKIKVPRCLLPKSPTQSVQLHVFCDASERGYGACIYIRTVDSAGEVDTRLIMSKAKVSPVKQVSIPRLELLAATVGVKLFQIVSTAFENARMKWDRVFAYSDSTTVLAWLSRNSRSWVTFVSNRVSAILEVIQRSDWYHVKTQDNPADLASRGCHPGELAENAMWWTGPEWLKEKDFTTPSQEHLILPDTIPDQKPEISRCFFANVESGDSEELFQDLKKTSNFEATVRVTVHVIKFLSKFSRYSAAKRTKDCNQMLVQFNDLFNTADQVPYVTPAQATHIRNLFIKREQLLYLGDEIRTLEEGKELHKSHKIHDLYPFVEDGLLKVGGRLAASNSLTDQQKYPAIVPAESPLSELLISHAHKTLFHGTKQGVLAVLRRKYWIVKASQKVKNHIRNCTTCFKVCHHPAQPTHGGLTKRTCHPVEPLGSHWCRLRRSVSHPRLCRRDDD